MGEPFGGPKTHQERAGIARLFDSVGKYFLGWGFRIEKKKG
jgi:hypothetical protein